MCYSEIFELRRQIHELCTNAAIMETALRAYEDVIEERDEQIEELNIELSEFRFAEHDFSPYRIIVSRYNKGRLANITYAKTYNDTITELLDHAGKAHDTQLKLYVWSDFCNGYTNGLAFAIAETENEARLLVMDETGNTGYREISWGEVEVNPISKCARYVYGGDRMNCDEDDMIVVIDMNGYSIVEYYGYYDHDSVEELLNNMEEALEFIEDQIDKNADWIKCRLVWERGDQDDCNSTYLELEYIDAVKYPSELEDD